ncbi:hypothetical protein Dda_1566 [Drechslerella dactyloides]|uniref:Uncharacterized protein n=1 Tax=Drechslerella dactyloides TaxID=74499 RepID=A0AAD6J1Y5_DREDA|nr:hypothetical protein Dda_1566 [Drechslerella dactyloides]
MSDKTTEDKLCDAMNNVKLDPASGVEILGVRQSSNTIPSHKRGPVGPTVDKTDTRNLLKENVAVGTVRNDKASSQPTLRPDPPTEASPAPKASTTTSHLEPRREPLVRGGYQIPIDLLRLAIPELAYLPSKRTTDISADTPSESMAKGKSKKAKKAAARKRRQADDASDSGSSAAVSDSALSDEEPSTQKSTTPGILEEQVDSEQSSPPTMAASPEDTGSQKPQQTQKVVIDPPLFELLNDLSLFYKWEVDDFKKLDRNSHLAFFHIYARDKTPPPTDDDKTVFKKFVEHIYKDHYWLSMVREAVLFCAHGPLQSRTPPGGLHRLLTVAEDYHFLMQLGMYFKERELSIGEKLAGAPLPAGLPEDTEEGEEEDEELDEEAIPEEVADSGAGGGGEGQKKKKKRKRKKKNKAKGAATGTDGPVDGPAGEAEAAGGPSGSERTARDVSAEALAEARTILAFEAILQAYLHARIARRRP